MQWFKRGIRANVDDELRPNANKGLLVEGGQSSPRCAPVRSGAPGSGEQQAGPSQHDAGGY